MSLWYGLEESSRWFFQKLVIIVDGAIGSRGTGHLLLLLPPLEVCQLLQVGL